MEISSNLTKAFKGRATQDKLFIQLDCEILSGPFNLLCSLIGRNSCVFAVLEGRFTVMHLQLLTKHGDFQLKVDKRKLLGVPENIAVAVLRPVIGVLSEQTKTQVSFPSKHQNMIIVVCIQVAVYACVLIFTRCLSSLVYCVQVQKKLVQNLSVVGRTVDLSSFKRF